jgi:hypothetical protein
MFIIIYKFIIYIHILIDGASILDFALGPQKVRNGPDPTTTIPHRITGWGNHLKTFCG